MKQRNGIVKVEHYHLPGLKQEMDKLQYVKGVRSIIPARIHTGKHPGKGILELKVSRRTISGLKLIAKYGACIQEVYVTCSEPYRVERVIDRGSVNLEYNQ